MNIGLEYLTTTTRVKKVASMESIISEYSSCEAMFASTNRFCEYGDNLFNVYDNIYSIYKTARKVTSNEGLQVLNALVGNEFGGHISNEGLKDTAKSVWMKIKEFFTKIWTWIKMFFQRIISLFTKTESRLKKLEVSLSKAQSSGLRIKEWKYVGLPNLLGKEVKDGVGLDVVFKSFSSSIDGAATAEAATKIFEDAIDKRSESASYGNMSTVITVADSLIKVRAVINMLKSAKALSNETKKQYNVAKNKVDTASKKDTDENKKNIEMAKLEQHKMNLKVKWLNKVTSLATRSAMSVLAGLKGK